MRASFFNPNYFCSFNSLTQCFYNIESFRNLVLGFDPERNPPRILKNEQILPSEMPEKVLRAYNHHQHSVQFAKDYIEIMKQMHQRGKHLDLTDCVDNLEDVTGRPILKYGATDPQLEFLAVLQMFSIADGAFLCPYLQPMNNPFMSLFGFLQSRGFEQPSHGLFLTLSDDSSIFHVNIEEFFHDFRKGGSNDGRVVLHSLPDVICAQFKGVGNLGDRKLQTTLDFTHYVFDDSKKYVYQINSIVMLLNEAHAVAYVRLMEHARTPREKWLICNDLEQHEVTLAGLHEEFAYYGPSKRACMAFYERML